MDIIIFAQSIIGICFLLIFVFFFYFVMTVRLRSIGDKIGELDKRLRSGLEQINSKLGIIQELRDYSSQLEQQLKEKAEKLQRSNQLKDLFTDIMRHDLLNWVYVIKGASELIVGKESNLQEEIQMIQRNAAKLEKTIEDASKFAKLENLEETEFKEMDLATVIRECAQGLKNLAAEKKIKIECEFDGEYPARVNPFIEDVFSNLISNAIKYSPENSRVLVSIEGDADKWRISVKDNGEGIPDESKEVIFERFKRVGGGGVGGMGLGLAIVKRIVELHRGRVWVGDNPEGGSIFYVTVPK
jgi:signal transduction histidine kinase